MVTWGNKPAVSQTWTALQDYFTEKWLERKQYSATMAKQSQFKEAALQAQEAAAAEEALLQDQHMKQIVQMEAANKSNMDLMMEWMNALLAENGGKQ